LNNWKHYLAITGPLQTVLACRNSRPTGRIPSSSTPTRDMTSFHHGAAFRPHPRLPAPTTLQLAEANRHSLHVLPMHLPAYLIPYGHHQEKDFPLLLVTIVLHQPPRSAPLRHCCARQDIASSTVELLESHHRHHLSVLLRELPSSAGNRRSPKPSAACFNRCERSPAPGRSDHPLAQPTPP
jgi:hypothetical protein